MVFKLRKLPEPTIDLPVIVQEGDIVIIAGKPYRVEKHYLVRMNMVEEPVKW